MKMNEELIIKKGHTIVIRDQRTGTDKNIRLGKVIKVDGNVRALYTDLGYKLSI